MLFLASLENMGGKKRIKHRRPYILAQVMSKGVYDNEELYNCTK